MKVYYTPHTCSLATLIALHELGLPYDKVKVDLHTRRTADGADFYSINPKGYVAALQLDNGDLITEAPAILTYLADLKPDAKLAPPQGTTERLRLQEWLSFLSSEIHATLTFLFYPNFPEDAKEVLKAKAAKRLDFVESRLSSHDYLLDSGFTVADGLLFTLLGWLPGFHMDVQKWPGIAAFVKRVEARPSVAAAAKAEQD
ncbi:hypothetical protein VTK73DRAFT_8763 [Phialemonium thermophilum]|uniref:Glutathione S-transferase n=1 Tax=Phialemonium thermophilum TaxID=223376 RepID=A0ABR3W698_9PEZI